MHTHTHADYCCNNNVLFHLVCVARSLGLAVVVVGWRTSRHYQPTNQPTSQPATHTNVFAFVCLLFHTYIYICMCSTSHRQTETSISLSIHSLGSCCLHTLAHCHHHHHTTRAVRVCCVCVRVCAFGSLSSNASDVLITGQQIMIIITPRTNNRRTPRHCATLNNAPRRRPIRGGA